MKIKIFFALLVISLKVHSVEFSGDAVQGGLLQGKTEPGNEVLLGKKTIRTSSEGVFLIGFGRNAQSKIELSIKTPENAIRSHFIEVKQRKYKEQRIDGLPANKVEPNQKELDRIWSESKLLKAARRNDDPRLDFMQEFIWPVTGRISGVYGSRRILNGKPKRPHYGVDVAAPNGTPIQAPANGVVTLVHEDMFFTGGTLVVDHGHGLTSTFIHLSKILVEQGANIQQGDIIAEVGATGRATGPHLHWSMNWFTTPLDPMLVVGPMPKNNVIKN